MTPIDYDQNEQRVRWGLGEIWKQFADADAVRQDMSGCEPDPHIASVGILLHAEDINEVSPSYRPAYEALGGKGLLLVAAAVLYWFTERWWAVCPEARKLLTKRLRASSDDVRLLLSGPVGPHLPAELPLEG